MFYENDLPPEQRFAEMMNGPNPNEVWRTKAKLLAIKCDALEAENGRLRAALDGIHTWAIDLPDAQTRARNAIVAHQQSTEAGK